MSRQTLPVDLAPGNVVYNGALLTKTAEDAVNHSQFLCTGAEILIAENSDDTSHTVTVTSVADAFGRTKDISQAIAAGAVRVFGPFSQAGWAQAVGSFIQVNADDASVFFSVVRIPAIR